MMKIIKSNTCCLMLALLVIISSFPNTSFCQTPNGTLNLGILESFEGYTGAGAITNGAGATWIGDAGSNSGVISGFGTSPYFVGNTYNADTITAQCRFDLFRLYVHLNDLFVNYPATHTPSFGDGEVLTPGVYSIPGAGSIGAVLTLDGGGDPNAFFVIKFFGAMTVGAGAWIDLINGVESCNVFFVADGAISVAANANLKGTLFSKLGAVGLGVDAVLKGRMLTLEGAIVVGAGANVSPPSCISSIPIFCDDNCSAAPEVDVLGVLSNYALYTDLGAVANTGTTGIDGNIGTNSGSISGFGSSIVIGSYHTVDANTVQANIDLNNAYNLLMALPNTVPSDAGVTPVVPLSHAAAFGNLSPGGEVLYAGVYFINSAGSLGGILVLDGQNNPDAIFVFKFAGAFSVAAQTKMILINGAHHCNVFWIGGAGISTGAISIGAGSVLKGTFLSHGGACGSGASVFLSGRQLSTGGAVDTDSGIIYSNSTCVSSTPINSTLPIELLSFTSECNNQNVLLKWVTGTEHDNDYFSIEQSIDGLNWVTIENIPGAGNSASEITYNYVDLGRYNYISYYRLKQTDFNGETKTYSPISVKKCFEFNDLLSVIPNPAIEQISIHYDGDRDQVLSTSIYDVFGKLVYFQETYFSIIPVDKMQEGIYFLHLALESGIIVRKFLVKNKI